MKVYKNTLSTLGTIFSSNRYIISILAIQYTSIHFPNSYQFRDTFLHSHGFIETYPILTSPDDDIWSPCVPDKSFLILTSLEMHLPHSLQSGKHFPNYYQLSHTFSTFLPVKKYMFWLSFTIKTLSPFLLVLRCISDMGVMFV